MKQIEIADSYGERKGGLLFQTFIIDNSQDFPYYRPLYLVCSNDEKQAAQSGKNQYFLDNMSKIKTENWNEKRKSIKVIARIANKEKDLQIADHVTEFNEALKVSSRNVSEVMCRHHEETINQLILNY